MRPILRPNTVRDGLVSHRTWTAELYVQGLTFTGRGLSSHQALEDLTDVLSDALDKALFPTQLNLQEVPSDPDPNPR